MSEAFSGWTIKQLSEYVRDVGGNPDGCDTKEELIELAARLAVAAEAAALGGGNNGGGGGNNGGGGNAAPAASSSAYPEIEYSEQPRREEQQTITATTTGNPFAPSNVPAPMPAANALSGPRRRAVLVGCNYASTPSASLQGCINDASCLRHLLISRFGFLDQDIVLLLDTSPYPSQWPTRANILWHASSLSSGARSGDSLFFSFSGHGAQVPDQSGDEADGLSETICPCDFQDTSGSGGMILDDELNFALVRPLPAGAKLHSLLDCCHSGSTLNLEFRAKARDGPIYWKQEYEWQPRTYKGSAGGLIVGISASRDKQVAADTSQLAAGGSHTGAATFTFIQSIEAYGTSLSYEALLRNMKSVLDASVNSGPSSGLAGLGLPTSLGGGGGGAAGGIMGKLNSLLSGALDAAGMSGQTPCLTSNFAFDLNTPLGI